MSDAVRELAERWFAKAHRLEEDRCFPAGFERRMCARELLAALEAAPEVPAKPEVCRWKGVKSLEVHRVGCRTGMLRDWHGFTYCPYCGRKIEVDNG